MKNRIRKFFQGNMHDDEWQDFCWTLFAMALCAALGLACLFALNQYGLLGVDELRRR